MRLKRLLLISFALTIFFSCKTESKPNAEKIKADTKDINKTSEIEYFDDGSFKPLDVSKFLSNYLLIGEQNKFSENKISYLNILGYESYNINNQGLITKTSNITNNFSEFFYNKRGQLIKLFHKQHNPKLTYFKKEFNYSNDGELKEVIEFYFNEKSEIEKKESITKTEELEKVRLPFKRALKLEPYKIDTIKRLILTYRSDLTFCCGERMDGKNRLLYYYGLNGLIDSLIIQKTNSNRKMKFVYEYK